MNNNNFVSATTSSTSQQNNDILSNILLLENEVKTISDRINTIKAQLNHLVRSVSNNQQAHRPTRASRHGSYRPQRPQPYPSSYTNSSRQAVPHSESPHHTRTLRSSQQPQFTQNFDSRLSQPIGHHHTWSQQGTDFMGSYNTLLPNQQLAIPRTDRYDLTTERNQSYYQTHTLQSPLPPQPPQPPQQLFDPSSMEVTDQFDPQQAFPPDQFGLMNLMDLPHETQTSNFQQHLIRGEPFPFQAGSQPSDSDDSDDAQKSK